MSRPARRRAGHSAGLLAILVLCAASPAWGAPAGTTHLPDLQTIIPTDAFSIVQTQGVREFRYTHLVYNNGPGPLEIQPQYNEASGSYQGQQQLFTHDASGQWSLVRQDKVADAFVFHAVHGHFHFPLAAFGLYAVAADGGVGAPLAVSPKDGFCIADSYIYNSSVTHSGAFVGSQGSCADPSTLRGLSVGGADEYDYRDPGQAVPIDGLPDGTYWFRAISDPNNDLLEPDESNNETDVKVTISNGQVTPGQVTHPDTTPPALTLTAPAEGARVNGSVTLSADTPVTPVGGVQFLVDGVSVGSSTQPTGPYSINWDSRTVVDGTHWIAARVTDAVGRTNTSTVAEVTVANDTPPPTGDGFAIDGIVSQDGRGTQTTPGLATTRTGDQLLALVSSDGSSSGGQTAAVSGGGLNWSLVRRANSRAGTSEIWKATVLGSAAGIKVTSTQAQSNYDQSITVVAFSGSAGIGASSGAGAASGAPRTTVTTTAAGSWVFGVGNDWDNAIARQLGANQVLRHQWVDTGVGDTFWAQSQAAPTPDSGTVVAIDDTAPTTDQWNLAAVEVLAASPAPPPAPDTTPPQVTITDPQGGATLSGITTLGATASDNVGVKNVQFKVDGQSLGAPDSTPPFQVPWDTRTAAQGQHTITAEAVDAAGNLGSSAAVVVQVDNSAPPPAVIAIDKLVYKRARGVLKSPALTTSGPGEQIVAFVGADGPGEAGSQTATVTGAGLSWSLVKRSNTQAGDSEIWTARASGTLSNAAITATLSRSGYDGLLTVIAFRNAAGTGVAGATGAPSGAPDIYLPGVAAGSWVFAVGSDWDKAIAREPVAGQVLQQQWLDTRVGDTFWVQSTNAPSTASGQVTIHDNQPTTDRWNYAAVEVTASPGG